MKRKAILISVVLIIFIVIILNYGGLLVFWAVTPGDGELRREEIILFDRIKKINNAEDVWREPKYHISDPKDSSTYSIIIKKKNCNENIKDSLQVQSNTIALEIRSQLKLNPKFTNYEIIYECAGSYNERFKYSR